MFYFIFNTLNANITLFCTKVLEIERNCCKLPIKLNSQMSKRKATKTFLIFYSFNNNYILTRRGT